jgi:putative nucleotidyltransferase with HDIG domain
MSDHSRTSTRWTPRPLQARLIRVAALVAPIVASIVFVALVSKVFPAPLESFWLYLAWWVVLTGAATLVLIAVDRLARLLLPLAVLFKLSLVFPDQAPSRFRTALNSRSVGTLEERVASAKAGQAGATPVEAAEELLALVAALDTHDPLTRGHSDRVRAYAQMIAEEMNLSAEEVDLLNWAALLHDIGKLDVPTEILAKEGRPTDEEWSILKRHPELGGVMVAPLRSWLGEWSEAVTQHHERWDGKGYPSGASGDQIALSGRIVAIADVFDVITSARSYKDASDALAGREEIARCAGAQFDPRVVRAFLGISLGRLRFAMGPLSWLSHAPLLGRLPLTPAIGTVSGALAVATAALTTGIVAPPPPERAYAAVQPANLTAAVDEDRSVVLLVPATGLARIVRGPAVGSARVIGDGRIRYTPPRDFSGVVSFVFEVCDERRHCTTATARVVVRSVNDEPVARDDVLTVAEDAPVSIDVLANDSDPDGDALTLSSVTDVSDGSATVAGDRVELELPDGFNGEVTFGYAVRDGNGGQSEATGTVSVAPRNDPPLAVADSARTPVGVPVRVMVLENDEDGDGDPVWVVRASAPSKGETHNDGTAVTYTPPPGFQGVAHFTYTISDPRYAEASASVEVAVGDANLPPRVVDDEARVEAGSSVVVDVLANDHDPEGAALRLATVGASETGTTRVDDGRVRYSAPAGFDGVVSFAYTAADPSGATGHATVRVTVDGIDQPDQPPARVVPPASPARPAVPPPPAPDLPVEPAPTPPPPASPVVPNGAPSFTAGASGTVLEDAGPQTIAGWATGIRPGPVGDNGQSVAFRTTDTNGLLFTSGGRPTVASDGTLTFTSAPDASGIATVTVTAVDNGGTGGGGVDTSPPQTFTIVVTPVNDAPVFVAGAGPVVTEDAGPQSISGWATAIASGPGDESSQSVTFAVMNSNNLLFAAGGQPTVAADGTLTFAIAPNRSGTAVVSVQATDNGGTANGGSDTSAAQTFTIQVSAQPDPPVAVDDSVSVNEDDGAGVTFNVLANDSDPDGDPLTLDSFDGSTIGDGALTDNGGGNYTYVPHPAFFGAETFTYTAADGVGGVDSGTVTITVAPQPDDPVAGGDAYTVGQATVLTVPAPGLLGNDYDEDGDALTVAPSLVVAPTNGLAILLADGSFVYTPNPLFVGTDTFNYRIDDGTGRTANGLVTITVDSSISSATLYLQSTGPSADVWDISTAIPAAASPVPDHDGDGDQGLTIKSSDGSESENDTRKYQIWRYTLGAPLQLNGPVTLQLWSTAKDFKTDKDGHPHLYLYDCAVGGSACVKIAETDGHVDDWNGSTANWVYREITIGSVNRAIAAGRELRIRLLAQHEDIWVAMTAAYPSTLLITIG